MLSRIDVCKFMFFQAVRDQLLIQILIAVARIMAISVVMSRVRHPFREADSVTISHLSKNTLVSSVYDSLL